MSTILHINVVMGSALEFAFTKASMENKIIVLLLVITSLLSWTVIIHKGRQLYLARRRSKSFFEEYRKTRDPLELFRKGLSFEGAPVFEVYKVGAEQLMLHLKHVLPKFLLQNSANSGIPKGPRKPFSPRGSTLFNEHVSMVSRDSFESVRMALNRAIGEQMLVLEKGMIVLATAVAGGPVLGLLGTVWGVMETFSGIAKVQAVSLIAMAPGIAGALVTTVIGLCVAIPAMFAYNFMITVIRSIVQELENFAGEFTTAIEYWYVEREEPQTLPKNTSAHMETLDANGGLKTNFQNATVSRLYTEKTVK